MSTQDPSQHADVPYRGRDRRALITRHESPTGRPFFIAGFGLVVLFVMVFLLALTPDQASATDGFASIAAGFEMSAGALGVVAATLGVVRWRLAGDARALWIGTAVGVYSVLSIALAQLLPQIVAGPVFSGWIRPASFVVTLAVFAYALRAPEVDAKLTPYRTFGIAAAAFAALAVALALMTPVSDALAEPALQPSIAATIALVWAGFATAYILRGINTGRVLFAWYGLSMFGLTVAELARAVAIPDGDPELLLGSSILRLIALLYAVIGVTRELQLLFASQSSRLLKTMVDTMASHASLEAAERQREELAHEARNALTAIEGATQTLERFRENLDDRTRTALSVAVSDEIGRLQRLVAASPTTNHPVSFRLADIIEPQLDLARAQGVQIGATLADELVAFGRPGDFAEVLQNLLVNARIHGRNPVTVTTGQRGGLITVRVSDRGPGVPRDLHQAIFERGRRASDASGSGLGLFLSRQLMREQGGALWVEDRSGGGATFVLQLPAADQAVSASFSDTGGFDAVPQHVGNGGKAAHGHASLSSIAAQRPQPRARVAGRQSQQQLD